mgnify:CR=1 FL=1
MADAGLRLTPGPASFWFTKDSSWLQPLPARLPRNRLGSTPWGNTHTFHFTLATASNGGVFDASTGDAVQSGDTLRLGVLPAGCTIGDIQVVVSTGITGLKGKLGFAYTDGADAASAPQTVANFLEYVKKGHYDNTIFHRVIPGFMIQGGGLTAQMAEKAPIRRALDNEAANGLKNNRYTIAMARTPQPHSATSQFFINLKDNEFLNHTAPTTRGYGYAVFGKVTAGQEVVDKIAGVSTGTVGMYQDVPRTPVVIRQVRVLSQ